MEKFVFQCLNLAQRQHIYSAVVYTRASNLESEEAFMHLPLES